jgi:hypothetical protein
MSGRQFPVAPCQVRCEMTVELTVGAATFVRTLIALSPPPDEVWLIGSRANGRATDASDTDLLIFGSSSFAAVLEKQVDAPERIDCLVVIDGDSYRDPWQQKSGSLTKLRWQRIDESNATYVGVKWAPDEEGSREFDAELGDLIYLSERAIRVYPAITPNYPFQQTPEDSRR